MDIAFMGRARNKGGTARALYPEFLIVRMYSLFWHLKDLSKLYFRPFLLSLHMAPALAGAALALRYFWAYPMSEICPLCEDSGLRFLVEPEGERYAKPCDCRLQAASGAPAQKGGDPEGDTSIALWTRLSPDTGQADQSLARRLI